MPQKQLAISILLALTFSSAVAADRPSAGAKLSAAEIVEKNVSATGGLQAWRGVQSVTMTGKMEAGGNSRPTLPIALPGHKANAQVAPERPKEQVQLPF